MNKTHVKSHTMCIGTKINSEASFRLSINLSIYQYQQHLSHQNFLSRLKTTWRVCNYVALKVLFPDLNDTEWAGFLRISIYPQFYDTGLVGSFRASLYPHATFDRLQPANADDSCPHPTKVVLNSAFTRVYNLAKSPLNRKGTVGEFKAMHFFLLSQSLMEL